MVFNVLYVYIYKYSHIYIYIVRFITRGLIYYIIQCKHVGAFFKSYILSNFLVAA